MVISLMTTMVKQLVEQPESVVLAEVVREDKAILDIKVAEQDLGRVIGRDGHTIKALRELVKAVAPSYDKDIVVSAHD